MDRFTTLDPVWERIWTSLAEAAGDPGHAYRTLGFGTVQGKTPNVRSVVLRAVDPDDRVLAFHTDRRSQKVTELRSTNRIVWHGWNDETREQLRLYGRGAIHVDDVVAEDMWKR